MTKTRAPDDVDTGPVVHKPQPANIVPARAEVVGPQDLHDARLEALDDELLEEARTIMRDAMRFKDFDPSADEPPEAWIAELGEDEARKRFRVASAAWAATKDAPVGIGLAQKIHAGITKARAVQDGGRAPLNVIVQVVATPREYPRKRLSGGEEKK